MNQLRAFVRHPATMAVMFLVCCLMLPIAFAFRHDLPSYAQAVAMAWRLAQDNPLGAIVVLAMLLVLIRIPMWFVDWAFVSIRGAAGYEIEKTGSVKGWLWQRWRQRQQP